MREHGIVWESELCVLEARTQEELLARARELAAVLGPDSTRANFRLQDIAYSLAHALKISKGKGSFLRLAVVASSVEDLSAKLVRASDRLADPSCKQIRETSGIYYSALPLYPEGKVAFLFPGEGSPYINMLADLCVAFPEAREVFDEADRIHRQQGQPFVPSDYIFPMSTFSVDDRRWAEEQFKGIVGAISSVLTADAALLRILQGLCVKPDGAIGHSGGEQAALLAAGVYGDSVEGITDALMQVQAGADLYGRIEPAVLIALGTDRDEVESLIKDNGLAAEVAIDNCPHQVIVVLAPSAERAVMQAAQARGVLAERLPFDRPYHTAAFGAYSKELRSALSEVRLHPPRIPLYSCMTIAPFADDEASIADLMAQQWSRPIEFRRTIERMYDEGYRLFVEVGPRNNLTAFVEDCLRGKDHIAVASNVAQRSGITQINQMAGLLMAQGLPLRLQYLHEQRSSRLVALKGEQEADALAAARPSEVLLETASPMMRVPGDFALSSVASTGTVRGSEPETREEPHTPPASRQEGFMANEKAQNPPPDRLEVSSPDNMGSLQTAGSLDSGDLAGIAHGFLQTMDHFLQVQNQVMQAYFDATRGAASSDATPFVLAERTLPGAFAPGEMFGQAAQAGSTSGAPAFESAPTIPDADNGIAAAAGTGVEPALAPDSPVENMKDALPGLLKRIVSDRTGYPLEIIDLNADLEADLGIDSIKRVEILGTLRQSAGGLDELNLEALTPQRTLQQIIDVILAESSRAVDTGAGESDDAPPSSGASVTEAAPVVWGTVSRFTPGEELVVQRTFDPAEDSWLRDHVFGRDVSLNDPSLLGLPVMPLAVSIELMAQAAAALKPGSVVARVEKVRASRWVGFESGVQTVQVRARVSGLDKSRVMVELRNLTEDESAGSPLGPAAEATVVMAPSFEMAPLPLSMSGIDGVQLGGGHYYEDVLFHGPAWRVLDRIEANGSDGATAEVSVPGRDVFTHMGDSACILDPVMVDAGGQILGCWAAENLSEGSRVLPLGAESIELYGPAPRPGDVLTFLLKVEDVAAQTIRADFDIVGARGLYMRVRGWTSRRFHFPSHLLPLSAPGALPHISAAVQVDGLSEEAREASEARSVEIETVDNAAFLARIWSLRILSRRERGVSSGGFGSGSDLRQIAGLHVAKEAARLLLQRTYEYEVLPADIELQSQDDSTFLATGSWNGSVGKTLKVWLAQDGGRSVALASLAPDLIDNPAEVVRDLVLRAPVVDKSSNGHYK